LHISLPAPFALSDTEAYIMKTISQSSAVATAVAKVNGSAVAIVQAATQADKARGKLAEQVRCLFASPVAVISSTLSQVFASLADQLTKKEEIDAESWARIANSIATHVRQIWAAMPEDARPAVCYIALDRGACTANVQILDKPTKSELKAALGHDQKALNAANSRLFAKKPTIGGKDDGKGPAVSVSDKSAPRVDAIGAVMEQLGGFSSADLHELSKRIAAEIDRRTVAALEKAEKAGKGPTAAGKPTAKARPNGETQKNAKRHAEAKVA
jgi:type III secretory pathway component EscS